ncbi:uncharacterized protein LOC102802348 [Saccoglossus kowalevskii]|uniref:Uncharacterized protein LOC102802348 n=1 Tax=Saccoglossus kowalevskii TaxID=10224 RepID=A0ABM0MCD9_SACKO|nr:PREDICTED: uncharacterized protein LOC102802348 [Saccoglossus kowalevskii]
MDSDRQSGNTSSVGELVPCDNRNVVENIESNKENQNRGVQGPIKVDGSNNYIFNVHNSSITVTGDVGGRSNNVDDDDSIPLKKMKLESINPLSIKNAFKKRYKHQLVQPFPGHPLFKQELQHIFTEVNVRKVESVYPELKTSGPLRNLEELTATSSEENEVIILEGKPGQGKTTICKWLLIKWTEDELLKDKIVLYLDLQKQKGGSVEDCIFSLLKNSGEFEDQQKLIEFLHYHEKKLFIIVDGLDNYDIHGEDSMSIAKLFEGENFSESSIFVTVCPGRMLLELMSKTKRKFTRYLHDGIHEGKIGEYLEKYTNDKQSAFLDVLHSDSLIDLACNPLLCLLMFSIWRDGCENLLEIHSGLNILHKFLLKELACFGEHAEQKLQCFGKIAYSLLEKHTQNIYEKMLIENDLTSQDAKSCGFLYQDSEYIYKDTILYFRFIHQQIQNICAAYHLVGLPNDELKDCWSSLGVGLQSTDNLIAMAEAWKGNQQKIVSVFASHLEKIVGSGANDSGIDMSISVSPTLDQSSEETDDPRTFPAEGKSPSSKLHEPMPYLPQTNTPSSPSSSSDSVIPSKKRRSSRKSWILETDSSSLSDDDKHDADDAAADDDDDMLSVRESPDTDDSHNLSMDSESSSSSCIEDEVEEANYSNTSDISSDGSSDNATNELDSSSQELDTHTYSAHNDLKSYINLIPSSDVKNNHILEPFLDLLGKYLPDHLAVYTDLFPLTDDVLSALSQLFKFKSMKTKTFEAHILESVYVSQHSVQFLGKVIALLSKMEHLIVHWNINLEFIDSFLAYALKAKQVKSLTLYLDSGSLKDSFSKDSFQNASKLEIVKIKPKRIHNISCLIDAICSESSVSSLELNSKYIGSIALNDIIVEVLPQSNVSRLTLTHLNEGHAASLTKRLPEGRMEFLKHNKHCIHSYDNIREEMEVEYFLNCNEKENAEAVHC